MGVSVIQGTGVKVIVGKMADSLELNKIWTAEKFLNGGNPESPIKIDTVQARIKDAFTEIIIPPELLKSNPEILCIEWGTGGKVR